MLIDAYDSPDAQQLLRVGAERLERADRARGERIANVGGGILFLLAATLLAVLAPWGQSLSVLHLALVLGVWFALERVKFPVADGWTYPTMLIYVPALFLLPTPLVPLVSLVAVLLRPIPAVIEGRMSIRSLPGFVSDAWFSFGPALVLVVAGAQTFAWSKAPIYAVALLAEFACDGAAAVIWSWVAEGTSPSVKARLFGWGYAVDAALAPLAVLIASAAVPRPLLLLIALSPVVMLSAFARERRERLEQTTALSTAYRGTALLLGDVVEADDEYTGQHSRNVVDLALAVADALDLDATRRRNVEFAALLHDVGKIRVPKEIIRKPDKLDDAEWRIIRSHTIEGETMLRQVGGILSSIGQFVRSSHERWDGLGYPDGLAGEDIPLESRIVSACDAFSAMTTDRCYRPALSLGDALEELNACAGTQFDPRVAQLLDRLIRGRAVITEPLASVAG